MKKSMHQSMHKWIVAGAVSLTLSVVAFAAPEFTAGLNAEFMELLRPYNDAATEAKIEFRQVELKGNQVALADLTGFFRKVGPRDTASLAIDEVRYELGSDGITPSLRARGALGLNVTLLIDQATINELVPSLPEVIASIVNEQAGKFKDAVVMDTKITETTQDEAGNFTRVVGTTAAHIAWDKLPADVTRQDVPVDNATLAFVFTPTTGLSLEASVVGNAEYKGFRPGKPGLKEIFDLLISRDPAVRAKIDRFLAQLNGFADRVTGRE